MKKTQKNSWIYYFSLTVWGFHIAAIFINIFVDLMATSVVLLFFSNILLLILNGLFAKPKEEETTHPPKKPFDIVLYGFFALSLILTVVCGGVMLTVPGNPECIENAYYIVDHSEIVKTISKQTFVFLSVCQYLTIFGFLSLISTFVLSVSRQNHFQSRA